MAVMDRARTVSQTEQPAAEGAGAKKGAAGLGVLLALLATVVWSGSFVATRGMADSIPPVQAVFWRWTIATVAVAPFAARQAWQQRALIRKHFGYIALATLFGVTLYNTLVHQAGLTTSASNMGMIMAASPVIMALYARLGGERLGARRTFGLTLAAFGVLLLVGKGSIRFDFAAGDLWMFGAALSFATYSALLKRKPAELGGLAFLITTFVLGALMLAPAYAVSVSVQGGFGSPPPPPECSSTSASSPPPSPSSPGTRPSRSSAPPAPESSTTSSRSASRASGCCSSARPPARRSCSAWR